MLVETSDGRRDFDRTLASGRYQSPRYDTQVTWDPNQWTQWRAYDFGRASDENDVLTLDLGDDAEASTFTVTVGPRMLPGVAGAAHYLDSTYWEMLVIAEPTLRDKRTSGDDVGMLHTYTFNHPEIAYQEIWLREQDRPWPVGNRPVWIHSQLIIHPGEYNAARVRAALESTTVDGDGPFRLVRIDELIAAIEPYVVEPAPHQATSPSR